MLKKTATLAHMSGYYRIVCHVNMHCSGTTSASNTWQKNYKKRENYPEIPPKTNKKPPLETSKPENMLKMTQVRSRKQKCQKNKRALGSGRYYSQKQE